MASLAAGTGRKIATVFNAVEKAIPRVAGGKLTDLNAEVLSRFQAALRDGRRSEATIASYLATLQSALKWAADCGMIPAVPKIKHPRRGKRDRKGGKGKGRPLSGEEFDRMLDKVPAALAAMRARKRENSKLPANGWKRGGPYHATAQRKSRRHGRKLAALPHRPMAVGPAVGRIVEPLLGSTRPALYRLDRYAAQAADSPRV